MNSKPPISIQLADDHDIVRAGFRQLLENEGNIHVVVESSSGRQTYMDYKAHHPDILIMDISMPDSNGLDVLRRILLLDPAARVLILSMHTGIVAERALQMGARGFVCKRSGASELLAAIAAIMRGDIYLDKKADARLPADQNRRSDLANASLTRRELEVCMLLAEGKSVTEIARKLYLSEKTVYTHRQNIMDKLGVQTVVELSRVAERMGILSGN
jgi:two-component system, NarL family, invasion response regulator UvrY